jgi:hypothetical protein
MKRTLIFAVVIILIVVIGVSSVISYTSSNNTSPDNKPFYVGVTYGGNTAEEAKVLIDKVKDYTNLFVVQSDALQWNITELEEACDYAVNSGLDIIVYFGYDTPKPAPTANEFIKTAPERYGSHFLGVYYGDEPGGKMLDAPTGRKVGVQLYPTNSTDNEITKSPNGTIQTDVVYSDEHSNNRTTTIFSPSGEIKIIKFDRFDTDKNSTEYDKIIIYYPNGTITYQGATVDQIVNPDNNDPDAYKSVPFGPLTFTPDASVQDEKGNIVTDQGSISQFIPYQQVLDSNPLQNPTKTADAFTKSQQTILSPIRTDQYQLFTSDYALYWWDYKGGYDTVFAQLGWNNTVAQEIGLVRGAADLQGKSWGTIIDWKYTQPPYLPSGDEMYNQMRQSYECGAQYVVVFNYAENMTDPYGTLQDEHFEALQRFWNDVVQNPTVVHGGIKAEAVLVLPKDYGWGMRHENDTVWGLWKVDGTSQQIWTQLQNKLKQYGSKLDIVYNETAYPVTGKYSQIYYWNQSATLFATPFLIELLVAATITAAVTIMVIRAKSRLKSS